VTKRATQERYRPGGRRQPAQPLAASWRPTEQPRGRRPARKRGFMATYGWRVYAIPVLVAVTVFVVIQTVSQKDTSPTGADQAVQGQAGKAPAGDGDVAPNVSEQPAVPPDLKIPTADLPKGAPYTQKGKGKWTVLPGAGKRIGKGGDLFTYSIEVENGIDLAPYGGNDSFASLVDTTLADPRSWVGTGQVSLQRVDGNANPDIRISLSSPDTVHRTEYCGYSIKYESSCWRRDQSRLMINLARWVRGAIVFGGDIGNYRIYAINHEIGHAFGKGHSGCAKDGGLAPVMMQQSFGVSNNYVAKLNDKAGYDDPVVADGKTCTYNPWPNPQAR
jgi:hypothetical protein